jgi:hypothetical protein
LLTDRAKPTTVRVELPSPAEVLRVEPSSRAGPENDALSTISPVFAAHRPDLRSRSSTSAFGPDRPTSVSVGIRRPAESSGWIVVEGYGPALAVTPVCSRVAVSCAALALSGSNWAVR